MKSNNDEGWNFQKGFALCLMAGLICLHSGIEWFRLKSAEPTGKHWHSEDKPINFYEGFRSMSVTTSTVALNRL